jgi:hypothetical protein
MKHLRRDFVMPERDRDFLEESGMEWETLVDGQHRWLIIHRFPVPPEYNVRETSAALMIDPGYPDAQVDMVYFEPALSLSGKAIGALCNVPIAGRPWQRWSRHRTGANPWIPGEDCVETHLHLVREWLEREVRK